MQRFLRRKSNDVQMIVQWMGSIAQPPSIIQDEEGNLLEAVKEVLQFEVVKIEDGYMGIMLVVTEEVEQDG